MFEIDWHLPFGVVSGLQRRRITSEGFHALFLVSNNLKRREKLLSFNSHSDDYFILHVSNFVLCLHINITPPCFETVSITPRHERTEKVKIFYQREYTTITSSLTYKLVLSHVPTIQGMSSISSKLKMSHSCLGMYLDPCTRSPKN